MSQISKDDLIKLLNRKQVLVEFTKKDGSLRRMLCTLMAEELPSTTGSGIIPEKEHLLTVLDLEKYEWRTLNFANGVRLI